MEFFSLKDAPISSDDTVFREVWFSKLAALLVWIVLTVVGAWFAWLQRSWWVGVFPILCFLLVLTTFSSLRHALSASNWLLRRRSDALLVKYRSYLHNGSEDDDVVVRISYDELESVGKTQQRRVQSQMKTGDRTAASSVSAYNFTFLDLSPKSDDLEVFHSKLREERDQRSISRGLMYPVTIQDGMIRLLWRSVDSRVTPSVESALASITATGEVRLRPEQNETLDLVTDPETREKREAAIRYLIEAGRRLNAIELARKYYGCSMEEASRIVEDLAQHDASTSRDSDALS